VEGKISSFWYSEDPGIQQNETLADMNHEILYSFMRGSL